MHADSLWRFAFFLSRIAKPQRTSVLTSTARWSVMTGPALCLQDIAFVMGVGYTALSILLVDFFITYSELKVPPAQWASWISYTRYSMQGLVYNEYNNRNFSMPGSIVTGLPGEQWRAVYIAQASADMHAWL